MRVATLMILLAGLVVWSQCLFAQESQTAAAPQTSDANQPQVTVPTPTQGAEAVGTLTLDALQTRKKEAVEAPGLADDVKAKLNEAYDKAIAQLKLAEEQTARKNQYSQAAKAAPTDLKAIEDSLARTATPTTPTVAPDLTLTQAEQSLTQVTLSLEEAKKTVATLEGEPKRRADRRTKIPEESDAAARQIDEIKKKIAALPAEEKPSPLTQANKLLLQLQERAQQARIDANKEEVLFYDAANNLLAAQRDAAARQVTAQERLLAFWQEKVGALRQQAAQAARDEAAQAQKAARLAHPAIQNIAQENTRLADLQSRLVKEIQEIGRYAETVTATLAAERKELQELTEQLNTAGGVTDAMGTLLLGKRAKLPRISENEKKIRNRAAEIASAQLSGMEHDKLWAELSDLTDEMNAIGEQLDPSLTAAQREALQAEAAPILESRRKTLRAISDLSWDKATRLAKLDIDERTLVETVQNFAEFINANVLWVKSSHGLRLSDLKQSLTALTWLAAPGNWYETGEVLKTDLRANLAGWFLIALVVLTTIVICPPLRREIVAVSAEVRQIQADRFLLTARAFLATVLLSAALPACLLLLSWRLSNASTDGFPKALAWGTGEAAFVLFVLNYVRYLVMPRGLAQDHFRLREPALVFLRLHLHWLYAVAIPVVFVLGAMRAVQAEYEWCATTGRLFFVVGLLTLAAFDLIVLRPGSGFMEPYLTQRRASWLHRLRYLWYPLSILLPLGIAVLAGTGYFYGARYLNVKLQYTAGLIVVILLVRAMFVRGLVVSQRRLALSERQKRQAAAEKAAQEGGQTPAAPSPPSAEPKAKSEPTIFEMSQQTQRLIAAVTTIVLALGIWYIWDDVLPAFSKLGEHGLYGSGEREVTLGSVVTALVLTFLTVIVQRNVPGLLEILVLRRLPLDRGVRFAIITLCRYVIIVIGVVLVFSEMGIGWAKVQWLIAAMTVGLGFGLQEIFANFVSGLIILFEQPIRVDDVVTVGDVTGRVTMIHIRATTIRRWDQRELIVPNREFITGQLINWTLSDNILRRDFAVGIAYGSDIRKAEKILYEIAEADPRVLKDPPATVLFKGFGDNSLDFELRVNYAGIENNLPVWHDINVAIDDRFREAGIEIAFPQRDLHLRSIDPDIPLFRRPGTQPPDAGTQK